MATAAPDPATAPCTAKFSERATTATIPPPIGFNCRCSAIPISRAEARRRNIHAPSPLPSSLDAQLKNNEFVGNKNETFFNWLDERRKTLSKPAQQKINDALQTLQDTIEQRNRADWELLAQYLDIDDIKRHFLKRHQKTLSEAAAPFKLAESDVLIIAAYTDIRYHSNLNRYLRGLLIDDKPTQFYRAFARQLQRALRKLPIYKKNKGAVYRSIDINLSPEQQQLYNPDNNLYEANFTSAKERPERTLNFSIKTKTGRYIAPFSLFPHEEEVLIPSGTRFRIAKKEIKNGYYFFELEELPPP